jgi:hypothetical protein
MKHNHRILPGHMGGEYTESNTILVEVVKCDGNTASHSMWHYANWLLHKKEGDRLAWKALAGFLGKEEIIEAILIEARRKAGESTKLTTARLIKEGNFVFQQPEVKRKALEASQKTQRKLIEQGLHPLQNPEMRALRAKIDSEKQKKLYAEGKCPLQSPEASAKRSEVCSKRMASLNSTPLECPHCGKVGGFINMKRYHFEKCPKIRLG